MSVNRSVIKQLSSPIINQSLKKHSSDVFQFSNLTWLWTLPDDIKVVSYQSAHNSYWNHAHPETKEPLLRNAYRICRYIGIIPYIRLLYKYWDLLSTNSANKNSLSLMRSNLISHTIILTSEEYRVTTSGKIGISFSHLSGRSCEVIESECLQRFPLSRNHGFKVCRHKFTGTTYRGPRKRN